MSEKELTEDQRMVAEALHCADTGDAGHWPTAAGFLAAEVYRLREDLDAARLASRQITEWRAHEKAETERLIAKIDRLCALGDALAGAVEGALRFHVEDDLMDEASLTDATEAWRAGR